MPARYLHFIDQEGLHCHRIRNGKIEPVQAFHNNDEGISAFVQWLAQTGFGLHTLLLDVPDEGFHVENIPHVLGPDRRAIINRKLAQHFFGSPYSTALSLGRERSGRRDEKMLFAALTRPALLETWLSALKRAEAAVTAIYTVPLLTARLVSRIHPDSQRGLILLLSRSGIRQIFFEDGKLRFSRLAPPPEGPIAQWGRDCLREAQKTYQYLNTQRWLPRGTMLPVWVVMADHEIPGILSDLGASDNLQFHAVSLKGLAQQFGAPLDRTDSDCRNLLIQIATLENGRAQLAPPAERRHYRIWQARFATTVCALIIFAGCGTLALKWALDARSEHEITQALRADTRRDNERYNRLLATLPKMPTTLDSLRGAVDGIDQLTAQVIDPRRPLLDLSRVLEQFPDITLETVEWREEGWTEATTLIARGGPVSAPSHALEISASLASTAAMNPRATIARIGAFADALRALPKYEVTLLQQPFDTESDKVLKSGQPDSGKRPTFRLRLHVPEVQS